MGNSFSAPSGETVHLRVPIPPLVEPQPHKPMFSFPGIPVQEGRSPNHVYPSRRPQLPYRKRLHIAPSTTLPVLSRSVRLWHDPRLPVCIPKCRRCNGPFLQPTLCILILHERFFKSPRGLIGSTQPKPGQDKMRIHLKDRLQLCFRSFMVASVEGLECDIRLYRER